MVYTSAFDERVLTPGSVLLDITTHFSPGWNPKDADGLNRGPVLARYALQQSLNIPAIRTLDRLGSQALDQYTNKAGISFLNGRKRISGAGLAAAIGTVEVRVIDMVAAYGAFGNGGLVTEPRFILKVRDTAGHPIFSAGEPQTKKVWSPQAAWLMANILAGNSDPRQNPYWGKNFQLRNGPGGAAPDHGPQDRHHQRRQGRLDVRAAAPADQQGRAGTRARRLDGQQQPRVTALHAASRCSRRTPRDASGTRSCATTATACPWSTSSDPPRAWSRRPSTPTPAASRAPGRSKTTHRVVHHGHGAGQQGRGRQARPDVRGTVRRLGGGHRQRREQGRARQLEVGRPRLHEAPQLDPRRTHRTSRGRLLRGTNTQADQAAKPGADASPDPGAEPTKKPGKTPKPTKKPNNEGQGSATASMATATVSAAAVVSRVVNAATAARAARARRAARCRSRVSRSTSRQRRSAAGAPGPASGSTGSIRPGLTLARIAPGRSRRGHGARSVPGCDSLSGMPVYDDPVDARALDAGELQRWTAAIVERLGTPPDIAADVAEVLLASDRRGIASHGTARLPQYAALVEAGVMDPAARPIDRA